MEQELSRLPAFVIAVALAAGMLCQTAARHLRVPGIVLLLLAGVLLGPEVAGVIRPDSLGPALHLIVGMSVAVILFEGGLNLNLKRLRQEATTVRRLVTVGVLVTAAGATLCVRVLMGWSWELSLVFGSLVTVTGPTVMTPLLRRIDVKRNVHTILEGEGILIDPVGAILAVVTLEVVFTATAPGAGADALHLLGLPSRLVLGAVIGIAGGGLVAMLLRREALVPEGLENVVTLSLVLALFELSEAVQPESGIMAAATAGIVVGNMGTHVDAELKEFKEQLTVLLIGLLFILLASTVRLEAVVQLGWPGVGVIALLMLVVRPLDVAVSTWGTDLTWRERGFVAWLGPRGIVAAAMASLFAQWLEAQGVGGGEELQALVFLLIAATVVIQGGTGKLVADLLGVGRDVARGWTIVGANALGRTLARVLKVTGAEVVLVDSSARECEAAEREGLRVVYGDAASERTIRQAEMEHRRGVVTVTPNPALNVLLAHQLQSRAGLAYGIAALNVRDASVSADTLGEASVHTLFRRPVDLDEWRHRLEHGMVDVAAWRPPEDGEPGEQLPDADPSGIDGAPDVMLPLVRERDGTPEPLSDRSRLRPGDVVYFAWTYLEGRSAGRWLRDHGWRPVVDA